MKQVSTVFLVICFALSLTACSTMAGLGKDLKKGGEAIQKAASS
ncbi:MAG: entericidin A/B family lipoprotein [Pseudomonadales bacterium]|nr:entericidin A/B family lipoprotein [Pseudomonadales bacterium]NRA13903.1 entericidin A/B family lipoprotein [Oceanospirillaceae bacterium]